MLSSEGIYHVATEAETLQDCAAKAVVRYEADNDTGRGEERLRVALPAVEEEVGKLPSDPSPAAPDYVKPDTWQSLSGCI
jgi:hypothetical protein